jgi:hypothetical protein
MKKKLLFMALLAMLSLETYAQAVAYPVNDISQCNWEVFDLTVQIPVVLGNQDPENFTVSFFTLASDAENNVNPITTPTNFYYADEGQLTPVYIRVTNTIDDTYDVTSFNVIWFVGTYLYTLDVPVCPGTYIDLTAYTDPLQQNPQGNLDFTFYMTEADAEVQANAIANPENFQPVTLPLDIYVRATSAESGCTSNIGIQYLYTDEDCTENMIAGIVTFDVDGNGCGEGDVSPVGVLVTYTHDNFVYSTYTDNNGYYAFYGIPDGQNSVYVTSPIGTATPASYTYTMPLSVDTADFCLVAEEQFTDVAVYLFGASVARPGFDAYYQLLFTNNGTQSASGTVTLQFDSTKLSFVSASPNVTVSGNTLTYNYSNLLPFSYEHISLQFLVAQPPVANANDILVFTADITPLSGDINADNNTYVVNQLVVNSYDPNDISVNEGEFITEEQADGYLHYTVRFQNDGEQGNAEAINIRVAGALDDNLDWSTFEPLTGSHSYITNRTEGHIEFLFNNINLPHSSQDELGSHGYISYRVKPKANIQLGESISADAGIYFDFNPVVETNTVTTTVQNIARTKGFTAKVFAMYPNPANGKVTLQLQEDLNNAQVSITDMLGKTVLTKNIKEMQSELNISSLQAGIYFVKLESGNKKEVQKLVIR